VTRNARGQLMAEQQPKAPNVALARRWAESILLAYAVIPVLFFVFLLLFPQSRDDALMATGEVYLGNLWMVGLAYVAYQDIKRRPRSLTVKMGFVGALVILGLVDLLFLITGAAFYLTRGRFDGQVAGFLGGFFLTLGAPVLGAIGWGIGGLSVGLQNNSPRRRMLLSHNVGHWLSWLLTCSSTWLW